MSEAADLIERLRGAGVAEVDARTRRRAEYSSDASNYRVVPQVVVFPQHVDELIATAAVARESSTPITMRGGGTSTAGNSIGPGIVVDTSRHLNRVRSVDPEARTATVEPGTILDDITAAAAAHGLQFGPDPSTHSRATIGGSIGNNACGSRALRYGRTADNVQSLDVLTIGGNRFTAGRGLEHHPRLTSLVEANLATIRTEFGRFTRQVSGYSLEHLLPENGADLARFLVGTEGTLALTLGVTVKLVQAPQATALAVLGYADMPAAADAVLGVLPHRPVALEGIDARLVDVVRRRRGASAVPQLPRGEGWLFVETGGADERDADEAARKLIADAGALDAVVVTGAPAKALWRIREDGAGLGGRTPDGRPAWPGWEDAAVPPENLGAYLREFEALMAAHRLDGLIYGHFGDGCVHVRIDFPLADEPQRFTDFVHLSAQLVARHGGSLSGEHGDGRARGALLSSMYSPAAIDLFGQVKAIFDPAGLLNPGVGVDPDPVGVNLRVPRAHAITADLGFAYPHDGGDLSTAVHRCVGVGKCRADLGGVMCPSYQATRDEKDSTRARARVLQEVANGTLVGGFDDDAVAESLDLCLACKGCSADCPAGVDLATYKAEVLYQRYRRKRRPASHYALGWLPRWAQLATRTPGLINAVTANRLLARLAKRAAGVDQRRELPRFATTTFRQWFAGRDELRRVGTPVLLWADTFTNHFSPEVGQSAVRVLEGAGYRVLLTERTVCCGLTWISTGQLDGARRQLRRSLDAIEALVRAHNLSLHTPIVGLEPSCTAVLRDELTRLLPGDPRSALVAENTRTLAELLAATEGYEPPDLTGVSAVAQPHCHHYAVMGWTPDARLLREAGAKVNAVSGCCGLAGNFGVERGHYEVSVAVAENALLPAVRARDAYAIVLADGFSCRTQLDQLAGTPGIHLAQLLDPDGPTPRGDTER